MKPSFHKKDILPVSLATIYRHFIEHVKWDSNNKAIIKGSNDNKQLDNFNHVAYKLKQDYDYNTMRITYNNPWTKES